MRMVIRIAPNMKISVKNFMTGLATILLLYFIDYFLFDNILFSVMTLFEFSITLLIIVGGFFLDDYIHNPVFVIEDNSFKVKENLYSTDWSYYEYQGCQFESNKNGYYKIIFPDESFVQITDFYYSDEDIIKLSKKFNH